MSRIYKFHNPVKKGLVFSAEDYMYRIACDYTGGNGLLNVIGISNGTDYKSAPAKGDRELKDKSTKSPN